MTRQVAMWMTAMGVAGVVGFTSMSGCGSSSTAGCASNEDCAASEICVDGECLTKGGRSSSGSPGEITCATDEQCPSTQMCDTGTNTCVARTGGGSCSSSAECPDDQYCNTTTLSCQPLVSGFCKLESQCSGETPKCSAPPNGVGRCVECLSATDCPNSGATCTTNGRCQGGDTCDQSERTACELGGRIWNSATCFCESPTGTSSSSGTSGTSGTSGAVSSSSSSSSSGTPGCSTTERNACVNSGGSWNNVTCTCTGGGTSSSGSSGGGSCNPSQEEVDACTGQGGVVDYTSCQCVPPGSTSGGTGGTGGVGCDFFTLMIMLFLCPDGIDFFACTCSSTGGTSGGTSSSGGSGSGGCTDTCSDAADGFCDDGGPGSDYSICALGTDCTDCGPRSGGGTSSGGTSSGGTTSGGLNAGAACTMDTECSDHGTGYGGFCITDADGWPGGYCTHACQANADCGSNGTCVNFGNDSQGNPIVVCMSTCGVSGGTCRSDYACIDLVDGNQSVVGNACLPKCTSNDDCSPGYACNLSTGICG